MNTITTEAWLLKRGEGRKPEPGTLEKGFFTFPDISAEEVLAEPIVGCWEGNMAHAIQRQPIDICQLRNEDQVVIGNAGVVRILKRGEAVTSVKEGELCIVFCNGVWDKYGYPIKILAYDAPNTMGVLAKQMKLHQKQVIAIPEGSSYSLAQWAAFSLRYVTAWANWNVTFSCWRSQMPEVEPEDIYVWGWGGGVALAELTLAQKEGCHTAMIASSDTRLQLIKELGIRPIDRRYFPLLNFNEGKYKNDPAYRASYLEAEQVFLGLVEEYTQGNRVSIFIDNIGRPVFRATLKSLARQGVITTCGWKHGMKLWTLRASESIERHLHVHTHYARYSEAVEAVKKAEEIGWMAPVANNKACKWDEIPQLAAEYQAGRIDEYFPIFEVNAP